MQTSAVARPDKRRWRIVPGIWAVTASIVVGMAFGFLPLGVGLVRASYDLLQLFSPGADLGRVVIVDLEAGRDRLMHAAVIERMTADQAGLVVSDVLLEDAQSAQKDHRLFNAIRENGRVVLAGRYTPLNAGSEVVGGTPHPPLEMFRTNALSWGLAMVSLDPDGVVRRIYPGATSRASLPWVAREAVGALVMGEQEQEARARSKERWLKYYGPAGAFFALNSADVTNQTPGFFRDKFVFIGGWQPILTHNTGEDASPTPFTRFDGQLAPRIEILATSFLNLLSRDWLTRWPDWAEFSVVVFTGLSFGFALNALRPWSAIAVALIGALGVALTALLLYWAADVWFAWLVPAVIQIPVAFGCRILFQLRQWRPQELEQDKEQEQGATVKAAPALTAVVPDHTLLKCVGEGGYGEVWLARNAVGIFHAVKIVYRRAFSSDEPYEREFKGIQNFMPISHSHPGLVRILHVGRNDAAGFFFYIMEASDDDTSGQKIDPQSYQPRTLAKVLEHHGVLPAAECVRLGAALASALEHLHQKKLIHRDIKPANIIYVEGEPKFADIGLVTSMSKPGGDTVTFVGTDGFVAPEGPGSAAADIYGLGKVLYEACTGLDRRKYPELPTAAYESADREQRLRLSEIIFKACETLPAERYQSAAELRADLMKAMGS